MKRETAMSEVEEKLKTLTHAAEDFQKRQKSKKEDLSKKKAACGKAKVTFTVWPLNLILYRHLSQGFSRNCHCRVITLN